jgi:predicted adenylyl cyclase CyaB
LANEIELKAVVADPAALRLALEDAGAVLRFHGMMRDRRLDRMGELAGRDHVLRVRRWVDEEAGHDVAEAGWKGPTRVNEAGYKQREEIEFSVDDGAAALALFESLGYTVVEAIDRYVEVYDVEDTMVRIEWFPRMDVLVEIEGDPEGIEQAIGLLGLERDQCVADSLATFTSRYGERTGQPGILDERMLQGEPPGWMSR